MCFTTRGLATDKDFDPRQGDTTATIKYRSDMPYLKEVYPGKWNHMVMVYNKELNKKLVYINNTLVVDGNVDTTGGYYEYIPADIYDQILIGARNDADSTTNNPEKSFIGDIDEVRIYDAPLTDLNSANMSPMIIGNGETYGRKLGDARLDEIRLYNVALNEEDIAALTAEYGIEPIVY